MHAVAVVVEDVLTSLVVSVKAALHTVRELNLAQELIHVRPLGCRSIFRVVPIGSSSRQSTVSPPARVVSAPTIRSSVDSLSDRTEPSAKPTIATPGWSP